jgi:signal transduction histidine kinase
VLPIKQSSQETIAEVVSGLEPYIPDITERWRERMSEEFGFGRRELIALERLTIGSGCTYFCHGDFAGFFENVGYFGARLAKLQVDTRSIARSLELYQELSEPYLNGLFGPRMIEIVATLDVMRSQIFVAVSGAYFDTKARESATLLSVLDAELTLGGLNEMLQLVLEITVANFAASVGALFLRQQDSETFRVEAAIGLEGIVPAEGFDIEIGQGFAGSVAGSGEPEMVLDSSRDGRILSEELKRRAKTLWGVPLKIGDRVLGVMMIGFAKPYEWLPTERDLMRAIADRSMMAIERAQMTEAVRLREQRIAELSAHLLSAQEEERKRISRELHDETGQALMVIRLYLGMLDAQLTKRTSKAKVRETVEVVDRTIEGLRRIISRLSPLVLQELGLVAAIRKEAKDTARNLGVKVRVAISDDVGRVAPEVEAALYRVVQEGLHNIVKHAQAKTAQVQMHREGVEVRLLIEDDGVGITAKSNSRGNSFGLAGIKERVTSLAGEVRVSSAKGKGTKLEITVPAPQLQPAMSQSA